MYFKNKNINNYLELIIMKFIGILFNNFIIINLSKYYNQIMDNDNIILLSKLKIIKNYLFNSNS